ncbi:MAG: hypothetical protein AABY68_06005 [Pseudomonadota bacterium]
MVVQIPVLRPDRPEEQRKRQLVHSILCGVSCERLQVAIVACWMDRAGRLTPAHILPEAA